MKSFTERNPTIIGILVVALIAAGTGGALLLNGGFFKARYSVQAIFTDSAGLQKGDAVRVAGVTSGQVGSITQLGNKVQVTLRINKGIQLPRDSRAEIVVETLLGNKYVRMVAGHDWGHLLKGGSVIHDTTTPTEVLDVQNIGAPLLKKLDASSVNGLLDKIDAITSGQRQNVGDILTGLNQVTGAINARQKQARGLIDATRTVSGTLSSRDQDLLRALDNLNVVLDGLAERHVELATLLAQTSQTASKTADLVEANRPKLDGVLDELHADLKIIDARQQDLAASVSGLTNAIDGFASVGYSGPDQFPNTWANMYTELIGPLSPDALFGSCGLLNDAFDVLIGPDPVKDCSARNGPLPQGTASTPSLPTGASGASGGSGGSGANPLTSIYGPVTGGGS